MLFLVSLLSIGAAAKASVNPQASLTFATSTFKNIPRQVPSTTSIDPGSSACSAATSSYRSCISPPNPTRTIGITSVVSSLYECLCNSTTTVSRQPMPLFDAEVSMCVDFAVTASPVLYSSIASLDGYCSWIISGQSTTRGSSTLSRTTRAAPTETIKNPGNNGKGGIQNFTAGQIAGVSIGCASAVILGALA
ncbi:hypothetical protein BGZ60DRAFT_90850 [Tricladium varicosporioides]|nr:hypothetical protein BGZ60DRAFT_90850 [Hymenoscyphus varicosporioides]